MARLHRDPLVHFVVLGGLVFVLWSVFADGRQDADRTIRISNEALERMTALYAAEAGTLPGEAEIQAMVSDHIRNEALAREARRLGLDQGDTIVERRLAQKMAFMVSDLAIPPEPAEEDLREWHAAHREKYALPATVTFQHIYLGHADEGQSAMILSELGKNSPVDWRRLGDPFMLQRAYADLPMREVQRHFGASFAEAVFAIDDGSAWHGPVRSAFGDHLVRVQSRSETEVPAFDLVEEQVAKDWQEDWRDRENARVIDDIVRRYTIQIED